MSNDQTEKLEEVHWFDQLIRLKEPNILIEQLALHLTNKAQNRAASCLLANAYLFSLDPEKYFIAVSRRPITYTKGRYLSNAVGYRPLVQRVLPRFEKLKLIKLAKIGVAERDELGIGWRRRSRYLPTQKLLDVFASHEIRIEDVDMGNPEVIWLRSEKPKRDYRSKQGRRLTGKIKDYDDNDKTNQLREWLIEYNNFVQTFGIELPDHMEPLARITTTFHRVFNSDFEHGGRLAGHWMFGIQRIQRHFLRLNGEQASELDYKSMYPHLLYSHAGLNYHDHHNDNDPYQLSEYSRDLGKYGFLVAMTCNTKRGYGNALKRRLRDDGWVEERLKFNSARLLEAILEKHKPVEHLLFNKETANHCTYREAMLLQEVISPCIAMSIPILPMNDGAITIASKQGVVKSIMEQQARKFLVSVPTVDIKY